MFNISGFSGLITWFHNISMIVDNNDNPKHICRICSPNNCMAFFFFPATHVVITNSHMQYFHLDYNSYPNSCNYTSLGINVAVSFHLNLNVRLSQSVYEIKRLSKLCFTKTLFLYLIWQ